VLHKTIATGIVPVLPFLLPASALAEDLSDRLARLEAAASSAQSTADNAWVLTCSALVLLMTVPGLALFYGGLVRQKNVISTMLKSLICVGIATLMWAFFGYSLVFSEGNAFIGGFDFAFLRDVGATPNADYAPTIPHQTFMVFQLMFAVITPALITGAFAERIRFPAKIAFTALWLIGIYYPLAHMVWGKGGFLNAVLGGAVPALDFAGGTVVHVSSGVSALVCAIYLGRRVDYKDLPTPPHSTVLSLIGAALLWFGWFGFNAGSAPVRERPRDQRVRDHSFRRGERDVGLDVDRLVQERKADGDRSDLGRRRRTCRYYTCGRICDADVGDHHRFYRRRVVLFDGRRGQEGLWL
jgi:Amt family ammonium transporter